MQRLLLAAASVLESTAARLRQVAARSNTRQSLSPAIDPCGFPVGLWRCTHASEAFAGSFMVGEIYPCYAEGGTLSRRIYPRPDSGWAPYWDPHHGRFCYEPSNLDFEYVGGHPI